MSRLSMSAQKMQLTSLMAPRNRILFLFGKAIRAAICLTFFFMQIMTQVLSQYSTPSVSYSSAPVNLAEWSPFVPLPGAAVPLVLKANRQCGWRHTVD